MATPAQIEANRRNAQLSTGPRSAEGKSVSRFNALKTGIQAKSFVIRGEDPAELAELTAGYHRQFHPATPLERFLVDTLVSAEWQIRRLGQVEAKLWENSLDADTPDIGAAYDRRLQTFTRLHRRLEALERSYYRALRQLQTLQASDDNVEDLPELASFSAPPFSLTPTEPSHTPAEDPGLRAAGLARSDYRQDPPQNP